MWPCKTPGSRKFSWQSVSVSTRRKFAVCWIRTMGSKLPRIAQAVEALGRRLVIGLEAV